MHRVARIRIILLKAGAVGSLHLSSESARALEEDVSMSNPASFAAWWVEVSSCGDPLLGRRSSLPSRAARASPGSGSGDDEAARTEGNALESARQRRCSLERAKRSAVTRRGRRGDVAR